MGKSKRKDKMSSAQKKNSFWEAIMSQQQRNLREGLVNTGIEAQTRNEEGLTSIMCAALNGKAKSLDTLLDWYQRRRLLRAKGWLNLRDDEGRTALMLAASRGHLECIEALIDKEANPFMKDREGRTARDYAVMFKKTEAVKLIDEMLRESESEEELAEGEDAADGLTSTQRSKLKKKRFQEMERRGAKEVAAKAKEESDDDDGAAAPAPKWDEVKNVLESIEMLREIHEVSIVREAPETGLEGGVDPALWFLKNINRLEMTLAPGVLTALPGAHLKRLKHLQTLILNKNSLTSLPDEIGKLTELKILEVEQNALEQLPESLNKLENLELLNCSFNKLSSLPVLAINCLTTLNVSGNQLTSLDVDFGRLPRLKTLMFADNNVQVIPDDVSCLTNLIDFVGDNNKIEEIPVAMTKLRKIKMFKLDNNPIDDPKVVKLLKQGGKGMKDLWKYLPKAAKRSKARGDAHSAAAEEVKEEEGDAAEEEQDDEDLGLDSDDSFDITMEEL